MTQKLYLPALEKAVKQYFGHLSSSAAQALIQQFEWVELLSGTTLLEAGAPADGMYILLVGRLTAYAPNPQGELKPIGAIFRGETVGEMGLLSGSPRNATVIASRDSVLVKLGKAEFEAIYQEHPAILREFAQTIITRLQQANEQTTRRIKPNLAFVPLHPMPDFEEWMAQFHQTLAGYEPGYLITQDLAARTFDLASAEIETADGLLRLNRWLAEVDNRDAYVLYQAQASLSQWTRKCVRQADTIYLMVDPRQAEISDELLAYLQERRARHPEVRYQLVFLHDADTDLPQGSRKWLDRIQPDQHHHLRRNEARDFRRLARMATNRTIGMACGGGGAKGLAHMGVFKALQELGVEVDRYGGTSIGAILAATQALDWSEAQMVAASRRAFVEEKIAQDYHFPFFSLLQGRRKEHILRSLFDYQIEDLWRPFLCVSCNLSTNQMVVHEQGSLWEAITASSALPGVFPPFIQNGDFLVDGALMNNLPGDLLRERDSHFLISVDVSISKAIHAEAETFPSNWEVFRRRFSRKKRRAARFPSLFQTFMRSSYLASTKHATQVNQHANIALQPPVKHIGLLGWEKVDQAIEAGYAHAMAYFEANESQLIALQSGIMQEQRSIA